MYDTQEEYKQKLGSTVVLFDGKPVLIHEFSGKGKDITILFYKLPLSKSGTGEGLHELANDPRWDFKKLGEKLGYINLVNSTTKERDIIFSSRIPTRHSVQGLSSRTVGLKSFPENKFNIEWATLLTQESLTDTLMNKFPSRQKAFDIITGDTFNIICNVAIGRKYALSYNRVHPPGLVYRGENIAYTEDGKLFKLAKHKLFMKEELVDIENFEVA